MDFPHPRPVAARKSSLVSLPLVLRPLQREINGKGFSYCFSGKLRWGYYNYGEFPPPETFPGKYGGFVEHPYWNDEF